MQQSSNVANILNNYEICNEHFHVNVKALLQPKSMDPAYQNLKNIVYYKTVWNMR